MHLKLFSTYSQCPVILLYYYTTSPQVRLSRKGKLLRAIAKGHFLHLLKTQMKRKDPCFSAKPGDYRSCVSQRGQNYDYTCTNTV